MQCIFAFLSSTRKYNKKLLYFILFFFMSHCFCKERVSSYPYLSGDTWRFFCDWTLSDQEGFDPKKVRRGDTIFVEYNSLKKFSRKYLRKIEEKFILITPNCENGSDSPLPGIFAPLLENKKIAAWFLQNIDCPPSKRVIPIPIGLANQIWDHGNITCLDSFVSLGSSKREI